MFGLSIVGFFMLRSHAVEAYAEAGLIEVWITDIQAEEEHQYDGTCEIQLFGGKLVDEEGDEIEDESLSFDLGVGTIEFPNVASNIPVETNITLLGASASLYHLNQPTDLTTSVIPATISITNISVEDKTYDGNDDAGIIGYDINGIIEGDNVAITKGIAKFEDKKVGNNKTVTFSSFSINDSGDASNYTIIQPSSVVASIIAKAIHIENVSVENKEYDGNGIANIIDYDVSGIIEGDSVEVIKGTAWFNNKNVGNNKTVTLSDFSISGSDAGNYTIIQPNPVVAAISAKEIYVSNVSVDDKIYDGNDVANIDNYEVIGILEGDSVEVIKGIARFENKNVGSNKVITFSNFSIQGSDAGNYILTQPNSLTASIQAKLVSIDGVSVANKEYDGTTEAAILETGFINGKIDGDEVSINYGQTQCTYQYSFNW